MPCSAFAPNHLLIAQRQRLAKFVASEKQWADRAWGQGEFTPQILARLEGFVHHILLGEQYSCTAQAKSINDQGEVTLTLVLTPIPRTKQ